VPRHRPPGAGSDHSVPFTKSAPIDEKRTLPESFRHRNKTQGVRAPQSSLRLRSAKNQRYVGFLRNFAWWSPLACQTTQKYKNMWLIDFKQRRPCISGVYWSIDFFFFFLTSRRSLVLFTTIVLRICEFSFFALAKWDWPIFRQICFSSSALSFKGIGLIFCTETPYAMQVWHRNWHRAIRALLTPSC
jgi:hypothetical protein